MPKKNKKTTNDKLPASKKSKAKPRSAKTVPPQRQSLPGLGKIIIRKPITSQVRTPCCVDVLKTGQAYAVPFGFSDIKGTKRIPPYTPVSPPPIIPETSSPSVSVTPSPPKKQKPILTQQKAFSATFGGIMTEDEPIFISTKKAGIPIQTQTEDEPPAQKVSSATQTILSTTGKTEPIFISTKKASIPIQTQTEEEVIYPISSVKQIMKSMIRSPTSSEVAYPFEEVKPSKKAVRFALIQRYEELTGNPPEPKITNTQLKKIIDNLEKTFKKA